VMTVSLPRGKTTDRSESWNRESASSVLTTAVASIEVLGAAAWVVGTAEAVVGSTVTVGAASYCLPEFQANEAFSKLILVLTSGGSDDRFKLETHSGTASSALR
jgi:hypothetical protein